MYTLHTGTYMYLRIVGVLHVVAVQTVLRKKLPELGSLALRLQFVDTATTQKHYMFQHSTAHSVIRDSPTPTWDV